MKKFLTQSRLIKIVLGLFIGMTFCCLEAKAQDPALPSTNLGLANITDGITPGPGFYYANFSQLYQAHSFRDGEGNKLPTNLKVNFYTTIHQFVWLGNNNVLGGLFGLTAFLPIVRISATNAGAPTPSINNGALGNIIVAPAIVWGNRKLFNHPYFSRAEIDFILPTGSYNQTDAINPGSHFYTFSAHYSFTYFFNKDLDISSRNHINYNTKLIGTDIHPGMFYNVNFSVEQTIYKTFRAEACAYYLTQLNQDSNNGDSHYYQNVDGIANTKERVLGIGPGLAYLANQRLVLEGKVFWETAVRNREQGVRPTMQLSYKF